MHRDADPFKKNKTNKKIPLEARLFSIRNHCVVQH